MKQQGKGIYHMALHCNPIVKPCSSRLSMSHPSESSLQEFEHFIERLYFGINKRLDNNLITTKIKKVKEVNLNVRDMKKEVLTTFEIREKIEKNPIAFVVKEEVEELEIIRMVQKNVDFNGIGFRVCVPKLVQEYISSTQITSIIVGFSNQHS
jgi:hypothetical protein